MKTVFFCKVCGKPLGCEITQARGVPPIVYVCHQCDDICTRADVKRPLFCIKCQAEGK